MQTKPLRSYGIDVTQNTMQPILESLGITDRTVKQLSQAEKEILRYIATLQQAEVAMGDMANTIESPSNQIKIFRQQLIETKVAITSLFMGTFANILPYANAFLMVVKEVSKAIADMFGIELIDYNSGIASQEDAYADLSDSVDDATDSVKELKRQTLGFDQINNINESKDSNKSGNLLNGGIDQRLLDSITGYDNGLDKVKTKASEIRDSIMDWLGFTKQINPLTGEVGFKLKNGETVFKNILGIIETVGNVLKFVWDNALSFFKIIIGYKILKGLTNIYDVLKKAKTTWSELGNLGTIVLTASVVFTLANEFSKTGFYQDYAKSILGDNYEGKDWFGMIGSIPSKLGQLDEINSNSKSNEIKNLMHTIYINDMAKQSNNKEIIDWSNEQLKSTSNLEKIFVGSLYNDYLNNKDLYEQLFGGTSIFDEQGTNINNYTKNLQAYFDTISNNIPSVANYNSIIETSETNYKNANEELGMLLAQMNTDQYDVTAEDITKINNCLQAMKIASNESGQAFVDGITKIVINLQKQGKVSDEVTQKVITNAKKQQLAEQGKTEEMIKKITELDEKLRNKKITDEEYTKSLIEIYKTYDTTSSFAEDTANALDVMSNSISVTGKTWGELGTNINNAKDMYTRAIEDINTSSQSNTNLLSKNLTKQKKEHGEYSKEYKIASNLINESNEQQSESIKKVETGYANYLNNMLTSLVNSKDIFPKEGQELADKLNAELKKLGYGVEDDIINNLDKVKEQLKMNGVKIGSGIEVSSDLTSKIKNSLTKAFGGLISFGLGDGGGGFRANGGVYSNGSWKNIPQYANGGIPSHGSMFVAGENGSEIVGNINGRTEVLNQSQIASSIYSAVLSAMSQVSGQVSQIDVHVHTDEGTVVDRINQKTKQTGTCPINIPA